MQKTKNKLATIIALIMILAIASPILAVPNASAHTPPWTIVSYAYLSVAPNPVGVGQPVAVCMWVDAAMPSATIGNDIRRYDYTLTITLPDGKTETKHWDVLSDTTGVQYLQYVPSQVGEYTFTFNYPGQTYTWSGAYQNDTFTASSRTRTLIVQQEPLSNPITSYPLPTEYWTRPIEGQNTDWHQIASNWLGQPFITGAGSAYIGGQQPYGTAPTSAHIMWKKQMQFGGIVGGNDTNILGEGFYTGLSYNTRFSNALLIYGILYYAEPYGNSGSGGDYVAVNLRTGQEIWRIDTAATGTNIVPSFGYLYALDTPNQHGVLPNGLLVASSTVSGQGTVWRGYDPRTGKLTTMNITNVPAGTNIGGPNGEYLKYVLENRGTTTNPNYYLMQWNSSKVFGRESGTGVGNWYSGTINASLPNSYDWNVSLTLPPGTWSIGTGGRGLVPLIDLNDKLLLIQGSFGGHVGDSGASITSDPGNITAISLKPESRGSVLWTKSYPQAPGNNTRLLSAWDPEADVFVFWDKESFAYWGYSLQNGEEIWGPTYPPDTDTVDWNFMIWYTPFCLYGNLYDTGFSGLVYCFDVKTGDLKWVYGNGEEGNSTKSGFQTPYGVYPQFVEAVADGKLYLVGNEHSPNSPMYKGSTLRCINATNGEELWKIFGWGNMMSGAAGAVADGYLTIYNSYDSQIYCYGKGPSSLTVSAPEASIELGKSLIISGTIVDISAGTKQEEQAARFPNGVPCASDISMKEWMEYVYMQKPRPTDFTGVDVVISVIDTNGNYRQIGTTTSDGYGFYSLNWMPDIEGKYTVYASFSGSESYWPSYAAAAFFVDPATQTPTPTQIPIQTTADTYLLPGIIGIIVAIAIVGIVLALLVTRKRP